MKLIICLLSLFSLSAFSGIDIEKVQFKKLKEKGKLVISFDGDLNEYPELVVHKDYIQVTLPDSKLATKVNGKFNFSSVSGDTWLSAKKIKGGTQIRTNVAFNAKKYQDQVALMIKDNKIELSIPRVKVLAKAPAKKANTKVAKIAKKDLKKRVNKEYLNESYLNTLLDTKEIARDPSVMGKKSKTDVIKTTLSGVKKSAPIKSNSSFSLLEYGGKFVAFLGVVLLLFYGVITLMKKGFIKKGKLGFLNKAGQIEVLSQTHIAPKKSLMMIRAHDQIFLVSNTDAGIHPISEIKDVAGLYKDGERKIAGNNFDDSLGTANSEEVTTIKLKEDITKSNTVSSQTRYADIQDKVSFSDQIKNKVKGLKSLQ